MENQNQNPNPMQPQGQNPVFSAMPQQSSSTGSIVATIIVIALLVLGGLYFWGKRIETQRDGQRALMEISNIENAAAVEASNIINISQDDTLDSLEAEIGATDISSVDSNI